MALSIISQPPAFSFSGNQIVFAIESDNYFTGPGQAFVGYIENPGALPRFTQINFVFGDEHTTMTSGTFANLDTTGTMFPEGETADVIATYFLKNYILTTHYNISVSGNKILFTAKKFGTFYNWKPAANLVIQTLGAETQERVGFRFLAEVFLENTDGTDFDRIYSEKPNSDFPLTGKLTIDIHDVLDAALSQELPDPASVIPFKCKSSKRRYFCRFAEIYGNPATVQKIYDSPVLHVANGGLSYIGFLKQTAIARLKPQVLDARKDRFLKQGPEVIRTRTDQPQYLYFINLREARLLYFETEITYSDGEMASHKIISIYLEQFEKVAFSSGFDQQQLGLLQPDKTPLKFTCKLVNAADEQQSEIITYQVDPGYKEWIRFVLYSSSLGAFDSFLLSGKESRDNTLDQQMSDRPKLINYNLTDGTKKSYALNYQRNFTTNTGWLTQQEFNLLTDFYLSEDKFLYQSGKLIPLSVTNKKIAEAKDGTTLIRQEISCSLNFTDEKFTQDDMKGTPLVLPPVTGLVHFGYSPGQPLNEAAVKALPNSQPDAIREFILNSGLNKIFSIAVPDSLKLHEAYDQTSEEDVTSEYLVNITSILVDGIPYKVYTMIMAVNYSTNHEHKITLVNV